ncbi:ANR family transcriptional regulator [Citrobacter braakii]|uniref:ANR family transcriptional regulator n=1 Tax=Citrobacter braakii TaxID=57706 RepID=UPI00403A260E
MHMSVKNNPNNAYFRAASKAVAAERKGQYDAAAESWAEARDEALDIRNQQWAGDRVAFCNNATLKQWNAGGKRGRSRV